MSDVIRPNFRKSATEKLMNDLRQTIYQKEFDEVSISELLGILEMLKVECLERTNKS